MCPNAPSDSDSGINVQWVGLLVILVAIALAIASSRGLAVFADSTLRLFLGAGILLLAGRETVIAFLERIA